MRQIILASSSPRRKEILALTGLKFKTAPGPYREEKNLKLPPRQLAKYFSLNKAISVVKQERYRKALVIGADTIVVVGKEILGKPGSIKEARKMLRKISGRVHSVITAFTIIDKANNKVVTKSVETKVYVKRLSRKEIGNYVESKEPLDKAGAYAIQGRGSLFIKKIDGDYLNVVGLPLFSLVEELKKLGVFSYRKTRLSD